MLLKAACLLLKISMCDIFYRLFALKISMCDIFTVYTDCLTLPQ